MIYFRYIDTYFYLLKNLNRLKFKLTLKQNKSPAVVRTTVRECIPKLSGNQHTVYKTALEVRLRTIFQNCANQWALWKIDINP